MIKNVMRLKREATLFPILLLMILAGACGRSATSSSDSDSAVTPAEGEEDVADARIFLNGDSIWIAGGRGVAVGTPVVEIPETIPSLYDNLETDEANGATQLHFKMGDEYIFTVLDFGEGRADLIMANTAKVEVAPVDGWPQQPVSLSSPFLNVVALPGAAPEWVDYDESGMWYWRWNNLWFAPDQSHLTRELSMHLYNEDTPPSPSDFDESIAIGYLATGIPF